MFVPDDVRKCVVFIGYQVANGEMHFAGSAFFAGDGVVGTTASEVFLVTARHVIDGIRKKGLCEIFIRINNKNGEAAWVKTSIEDWLFHPVDSSVDVALLRVGIPDEADHLVISNSTFVTSHIMESNAVGLGDEVFITGLFRHYHGTKKNIPIVRVGNLAAMAEEKVEVKDFGLIDAYLIEARSIGGLSGSPVFLNLGVVRYLEKQVKHATSGPIFYLLGLVHGHYDAHSTIDTEQSDSSDTRSAEKVNTGIAIVVPMHKILEVIAAHTRLKK